MMRVVLGLGSNRSYDNKSSLEILQYACSRLSDYISSLCFSSVYRSKAMYVTDQDDFFNMAVTGFFDGTPENLLDICHIIEKEGGRDRTKEFRNGPRSLDIDIEIFGSETVHTADLIIPHERIKERGFVLVPMLEILTDCADVEKGFLDKYRRALNALEDTGLELVLDRTAFAEEVYGGKYRSK